MLCGQAPPLCKIEKCWFAKKVPRLFGDALLGYKRDLGTVKERGHTGGLVKAASTARPSVYMG